MRAIVTLPCISSTAERPRSAAGFGFLGQYLREDAPLATSLQDSRPQHPEIPAPHFESIHPIRKWYTLIFTCLVGTRIDKGVLNMNYCFPLPTK